MTDSVTPALPPAAAPHSSRQVTLTLPAALGAGAVPSAAFLFAWFFHPGGGQEILKPIPPEPCAYEEQGEKRLTRLEYEVRYLSATVRGEAPVFMGDDAEDEGTKAREKSSTNTHQGDQ